MNELDQLLAENGVSLEEVLARLLARHRSHNPVLAAGETLPGQTVTDDVAAADERNLADVILELLQAEALLGKPLSD